MLKMIVFSVGFGFLATWFSSPRFLWRFRQNRITLNPQFQLKGAKLEYSASSKKWFTRQILCFPFTFVISFLLFLGSSRISLFCGGTLGSLILVYILRVACKPTSINMNFSEIDFQKVIRFWSILLLIYLVLFTIDNIHFRHAQVPAYEKFDFAEVIDEQNFVISAQDLSALLRSDTFSSVYDVNGKYVFHAIPIELVFILEKEGNFLETIPIPYIGYGAVFGSLPVPLELRDKNVREIGITVDNENTPYFVYALLKKEHFLGKYSIETYALWNATNKKIEYYDTLPDYAR